MDDRLLILFLSFCGAIIGSLVAHFLRGLVWKRETAHALQKARYEEGVKFLDELSRLVGRRFFLLQRLIWRIQQAPTDESKIRTLEEKYYEVVNEWNFCYWSNRNKIRLLAGEKFANDFLDYSDDRKGPHPESLHYKFRAAHDAMRSVRELGASIRETEAAMKELNHSCSDFLESLTQEFMTRAIKLQLFEIPSRETDRLSERLQKDKYRGQSALLGGE